MSMNRPRAMTERQSDATRAGPECRRCALGSPTAPAMTTSRPSVRSCVVLACSVAVSAGVSCKTARADDVTITGRRREVGATTLTRDELRELPGAFGDPGRAIEALPGVIPVGTAVPFSFVRGATPSDTAYFLDGMRVPMFSHGLPGGSVVAGSTIDRVDFFPGAAPARFGGATGGVLSVTTQPPAERARGGSRAPLRFVRARRDAPRRRPRLGARFWTLRLHAADPRPPRPVVAPALLGLPCARDVEPFAS